MKHYLIKTKVQDGENAYEEFCVFSAKSRKEALKYAYRDDKESSDFIRLFKSISAQEITEQEELILANFGVI